MPAVLATGNRLNFGYPVVMRNGSASDDAADTLAEVYRSLSFESDGGDGEERGREKAAPHKKKATVEDKVRGINRDDSLSDEEKQRRIQAIMCDRTIVKKPRKPDTALAPSKSYRDEAAGILGCRHYARKCHLRANCCDKIVTCRLCHDEDPSVDHQIDRHATKTVVCMECNEEQPVARECRSCGVEFGHYFCEICKFFDDDKEKDIYHCHDCGMCRVGKGVGIDNFHCTKCNACVAMHSREKHRCLEGSLQVACPICKDNLFTSVRPVVFMKCGHTMHAHCYVEYTKRNYTCPVCCRSLTDMDSYNERLEEHMAREELPPEYRHLSEKIQCNDCAAKSVTAYHPMYHRCTACKSFNTVVVGGPVSS